MLDVVIRCRYYCSCCNTAIVGIILQLVYVANILLLFGVRIFADGGGRRRRHTVPCYWCCSGGTSRRCSCDTTTTTTTTTTNTKTNSNTNDDNRKLIWKRPPLPASQPRLLLKTLLGILLVPTQVIFVEAAAWTGPNRRPSRRPAAVTRSCSRSWCNVQQQQQHGKSRYCCGGYHHSTTTTTTAICSTPCIINNYSRRRGTLSSSSSKSSKSQHYSQRLVDRGRRCNSSQLFSHRQNSCLDDDNEMEEQAQQQQQQNHDDDDDDEASVQQSNISTVTDTDDEQLLSHLNLPEGVPKGFFIVKQYTYLPQQQLPEEIHSDSFIKLSNASSTISSDYYCNSVINTMNDEHVRELGLSNINNTTLPIALTMLDPITYPSMSRARKACRKGNVVITRRFTPDGTGTDDERNHTDSTNSHNKDIMIGRVGDRVYTGDTVGIQVRIQGDGFATATNKGYQHLTTKPPPFDVPVIYQDDHYALVNKPAGVVCYRQGSSTTDSSTSYSAGLMSIRAALPFVLRPPKCGTYSVLRRPASVHRLDKPTSGLLCIVKTKPAMIHMSKQFHDRIVQKTYTAIVNGIPEENSETWITSERAIVDYGYDIDFFNQTRTQWDCYPMATPATKWQLIDAPLDDQHAITLWRVLKYVPSLRARDGYITVIECKPKTGRYHQLRRHMAWIANRPMVGDSEYDGNHPDAIALRGNGLFLCATGITHEHPYYNSVEGRLEWDKNRNPLNGVETDNSHDNNTYDDILWYNNATKKVMVSATIELPSKFYSLLQREEGRYNKFHTNPTQQQELPPTQQQTQ